MAGPASRTCEPRDLRQRLLGLESGGKSPCREDVAIILYMTTIPLAEARAHLSRLVEQASTTHERVEITKNGSRSAVLLGAEDYDAMVETLDILADAQEVAELRTALDEARAGQVHTLEEVRTQMRTAGRLRR